MSYKLWMVTYDISDDRARRGIEKKLKGVGERVQWSVFECYLSTPQLEELFRTLVSLIEPEHDSLRAYPFCRWCDNKLQWHGKGRRTDDPDLWIV